MLKLPKTTSPYKMFDFDRVTLYPVNEIKGHSHRTVNRFWHEAKKKFVKDEKIMLNLLVET